MITSSSCSVPELQGYDNDNRYFFYDIEKNAKLVDYCRFWNRGNVEKVLYDTCRKTSFPILTGKLCSRKIFKCHALIFDRQFVKHWYFFKEKSSVLCCLSSISAHNLRWEHTKRFFDWLMPSSGFFVKYPRSFRLT